MSSADGATKKSLFIQVRNYPTWELTAALEHVRTHHRDPERDDFIFDVVLDEIGTDRLHSNIDLIAPYLPGGPKRAFSNVFVGSHYVPWTGKGSAYSHGMKDTDHRWRNLRIQRRLWAQYAEKAPGVWHGYVNHEGVLDWLEDGWLRACYTAYLIQSRRDLDDVTGDRRALLWSPAVWSGRPLTTPESSGVSRMFFDVGRHAPPGVTWLHLQDMLGRGRADIDEADVVAWYRQLRAAYPFASLRVNMELFGPRYRGEDPAVLHAREDFYEAHGIPVGASFEMRDWMATHREL